MTIEQRLAKLERQNRWMRRVGGLAAAAVACVVLMGQGKAKVLPDLEVRSLTVKSKGGKELAFLGADVGWTALLRFTSKDGRHQARLGTTLNGAPHLYVGDNANRAQVSLGLTRGSAGFAVRDKNGVNRLVLGVGRDGSVFLKLQDAKGKGPINIAAPIANGRNSVDNIGNAKSGNVSAGR